MRIPVLTYHSMNIVQNSYRQNDLMALTEDLRTIARLGWTILPLSKVVNWHRGETVDLPSDKVVALTCDDGSWFDYYNLDHPSCGMQTSILNILKAFQEGGVLKHHASPHVTSFVITSPSARDELDKKAMIARGWWSDEWWKPAQDTGLMDIECHSWDHVHPALDRVAQQDQVKGDFRSINTYQDCDAQLAKAGDYIQMKLEGRRPVLFAYPWGQVSDYLRCQYLPDYEHAHGFRAAFTTEAKPMEKTDDIWALPRFVFGRDWHTPEGLDLLLANCA